MFYNYAASILTASGIVISLTGYYCIFACHTHYKLLVWLIISSSLIVAGFATGKLIQRLNVTSHTDFLTGLGNKRYFYSRLDATKKNRQLCIALIDVDDFKRINDTYGHVKGDRLLSEVAEVLQGNTRSSDIVARWGGDEFAVILLDASLADAYEVVERIRSKVENIFHSSYGLTISVGLIPLEPGQKLKEVLIKADQALYKAKMLKNAVIK
ncbi:MAG TPA: GGDEF domain-containing protein [Selenomonadales bacterium]|nr:GGDEF domain-containing protein [Selenomonadales bacterium]